LKEPGRKIQLTPYDDLFQKTDPNKSEPAGTIEMLPLDQLHPFPDHPFKLYSEDRMLEMTESVRQSGVLTPILVRPVKDGDGFEIISGHNRVEAAKRAGLSEVPGTIREMDNETAIIAMIDSNLRQREKLQPSEKAFAFKIKGDASSRLQQDKLYARKVFDAGYEPFLPHLFYSAFLENNIVDERKAGTQMELNHLKKCRILIVCSKDKTDSMLTEINEAKRLSIPIVHLDGIKNDQSTGKKKRDVI